MIEATGHQEVWEEGKVLAVQVGIECCYVGKMKCVFLEVVYERATWQGMEENCKSVLMLLSKLYTWWNSG